MDNIEAKIDQSILICQDVIAALHAGAKLGLNQNDINNILCKVFHATAMLNVETAPSVEKTGYARYVAQEMLQCTKFWCNNLIDDVVEKHGK